MSTRPAGTDENDRDLSRLAHAFCDAEERRATQRRYASLFPGASRVLDVGCGDGGFLDALRDAGIEALGIDASVASVEACRSRGHDVVAGDAIEAVGDLADRGERFDGVLLAHVIEHLPGPRAAALLEQSARVVTPGGRLAVVTPNVKNLIVLSEVFWLDPTHVRPYPRALIERLGEAAGLAVVASFDDRASVPRRGPVRRLLARWRSALTGADRSSPLDSVVVFERR